MSGVVRDPVPGLGGDPSHLPPPGTTDEAPTVRMPALAPVPDAVPARDVPTGAAGAVPVAVTGAVSVPLPGAGPVPAQPPDGVVVGGVPVRPEDVVTCPECGTGSVLDLVRRDASGFCPQCDFPLFWADRPDGGGPRGGEDPGAERRAPGAGGEAVGVAVRCPACGEPHPVGHAVCTRCGADLAPPPPLPPAPAPAPEPEPQVVVVREVVPCGHPRTWVVALVASLVSAATAVAVTLLLLHP